MTGRAAAFVLLVLTFLLWSNSFIAARLLVGEQVPAAQRIGPVDFVVARFVPVALFALAWTLGRARARRTARELLATRPLLTVGLGLIGVWAYNLPFAAGQHLVPPGTASLIIVLNPVLTFLLALAIRQERFSWIRAAGLVVAFLGVWVVVTRGAGREIGAAYLTDALVLAAAPLAWAFYTVFGKRLLAGRAALDVTFLILGLGSLPTLALALWRPSLAAAAAAWGPQHWFSALFLGLGCSVLGYALWFLALARVSASTAAAFVFLNPPLTLLFEWLWLDRTPAPGLLGGGLLVLAGVWLVTRRVRPAAEPPAVTAEAG